MNEGDNYPNAHIYSAFMMAKNFLTFQTSLNTQTNGSCQHFRRRHESKKIDDRRLCIYVAQFEQLTVSEYLIHATATDGGSVGINTFWRIGAT